MNTKKIAFLSIFRLIFVITILFAITITGSKGTILYQGTWSTDRGSEIKIEVTPNTASFQPNKTYLYSFTLTAVEFGSNVTKIKFISVSLRFLNARTGIIKTMGLFELLSVGSKIKVPLYLKIPSDQILSLNEGDSLSGKLQFAVYIMEEVTDRDSVIVVPVFGWETIVDGSISVPSVPPDYSSLVILGALGLLVVVGGLGIFFWTRSKKRVVE